MIKLLQRTPQEIAELAVQKIQAKGSGREATIFLPPRYLPPSKAYRTERFHTQYGEMSVFARPSEKGGWVLHIRFRDPIAFNPVIPAEKGKGLLEKLK